MNGLNEITLAQVFLWDQYVGSVYWDGGRLLAFFEYDPKFVRSGLPVAPLKMPLVAGRTFAFPELNRETYHGLPGLLADSLPDYFGNQVFQAYFRKLGRDPASVNPVERLCFIGQRGMGALEFKPALGARQTAQVLDVERLARVADAILHERLELQTTLPDDSQGLDELIQVGTSAGGARAKAIVAWNPLTNELRSGQVKAPKGFEYWLIKLASPNEKRAYGRIEYAYHLMAQAAGIEMSKCLLWEHNGLAHFMTRRFDRGPTGEKLHVQSLCAMGHYDFNQRGTNSYEDAFQVLQKLQIDAKAQLFRRVVFNLIARNQDDHTRNIAFTMDREGRWSLAPAFDVTWAYNPANEWTSQHQMSLGGKFDAFTQQDLLRFARMFDIPGAAGLIASVGDAVCRFQEFAEQAGVSKEDARRMYHEFRLELCYGLD